MHIPLAKEMGNLCSHDSEKIEFLENKVEDQNIQLEDLRQQNASLKRENKYIKRRLNNITSDKNDTLIL